MVCVCVGGGGEGGGCAQVSNWYNFNKFFGHAFSESGPPAGIVPRVSVRSRLVPMAIASIDIRKCNSPFSSAVPAVKKYRWQTAKYRWGICRSAPIGYSADVWDHMHFTRKTHIRWKKK